MDAREFENMAEKALENLFDALDEVIGDVVEVDFDNSILTLKLADGRQYIINKHAPNQEIWVSSPLSGAAHFAYNSTTKMWVSTRGDEALISVLNAEFCHITGRSVELH